MPEKVIVPRRFEDWFEVPPGQINGNGHLDLRNLQFTLRALRFFESLTDATNDVVEEVDDESGNGSLNAQLLRLRAQVGSGQPITVDTTGFTVDTTNQFTDQTEA